MKTLLEFFRREGHALIPRLHSWGHWYSVTRHLKGPYGITEDVVNERKCVVCELREQCDVNDAEKKHPLCHVEYHDEL